MGDFLRKMHPVYLAIPEAWSRVTPCAAAERRFLAPDVAACADADSALIAAARALGTWLNDTPVAPGVRDLRMRLLEAAKATDEGFTPRVAALRRGDEQAFNDSMTPAFNGLSQFCDPMREVRLLDPGEQWPAVECN